MLNLTVVVLAVGTSERFRSKGYDVPKQFLQVVYKGVTCSMLEHVNRTLPPFVNKLFVVPNLTRVPEDLQVGPEEWTSIQQTGGQAESAINAMKYVKPGQSVLFLDCDMLLDRHDLADMCGSLMIYDSVVGVTQTFDPNASRPDSVPFPKFFVEKQPINEWGVVSARGFRDHFKLLDALHAGILKDRQEGKEPYLTGTLNAYPGRKLAYLLQHPFADWGTPERLFESGASIWK